MDTNKKESSNDFSRDIFSDEAYNLHKMLFERQTLLLTESYKIINWDQNQRLKHLFFLFYSIVENALAIDKLERYGLINECFIIARSILERTINFCYLLICEDEEFENYLKYSMQKEIRKLDRKIGAQDKFVSLKYEGDIKIPKNYQEALEKFTSIRGKEITHWTKKNICERSIYIEKQFKEKPFFLLAVLSIYEDASDALHGTLYGSLFHSGIYDIGSKRKLLGLINQHKDYLKGKDDFNRIIINNIKSRFYLLFEVIGIILIDNTFELLNSLKIEGSCIIHLKSKYNVEHFLTNIKKYREHK